MKLTSQSFSDNDFMPSRCAMGKPDAEKHFIFSDNFNPQLSWSDVPQGTRSFVVISIDIDVPSDRQNLNKEGTVIPADMPRRDLCHWVMIDIPAETREIDEGEFSKEFTPRGKGPDLPGSLRHGLNDITVSRKGHPELEGEYYGYDGPCPPFNDELVHRYIFSVYALDVEKLDVKDKFTGWDVLEAIKPHILDKASITAKYTLNPDVKA